MSISRLIPIGFQEENMVKVREMREKFMLYFVTPNRGQKILEYINFFPVYDDTFVYRCSDGSPGERFSCLTKSLRDLFLVYPSELEDKVPDHEILLVKEGEKEVKIKFISIPKISSPPFTLVPFHTMLFIRSPEVECVALRNMNSEISRFCCHGKRWRRIIGILEDTTEVIYYSQ